MSFDWSAEERAAVENAAARGAASLGLRPSVLVRRWPPEVQAARLLRPFAPVGLEDAAGARLAGQGDVEALLEARECIDRVLRRLGAVDG